MRLFLIFLLFPIKLLSQDIEGVWTGTLYNDSTRKYIPYEIAITQNKGKLSGFSHTIFIGENTRQEIGVKTLKIKKKGSKILIEDDQLIYNNYAEPPPKGVRQYSILNIMHGDSGLLLIGVFNTNRTREYASLTGTMRLQKKNKFTETKLISKLNELNLASALSFNQSKAKEEEKIITANTNSIQQKRGGADISAIQKKILPQEKLPAEPLITIKEDTIDYKVDVHKTKNIIPVDKQKTETAKNKTAVKDSIFLFAPKKQIVSTVQVEKKQAVILAKKEVPAIDLRQEKKLHTLPKPKEKNTTSLITTPRVNKSIPKSLPAIREKIIKEEKQSKIPETVSLVKEKNKEPAITEVSKAIQKPAAIVAPLISPEELARRKIETIKTVNFKSDSLVLTLYDNGVVDGDTVSVILNGKIIMPKQGLSTRALTKTIYITPDMGDSLQLIMYAENLGSIAPNTGLLIIQDGEDRYQIRFAGDLQKNSAIILQRKKRE